MFTVCVLLIECIFVLFLDISFAAQNLGMSLNISPAQIFPQLLFGCYEHVDETSQSFIFTFNNGIKSMHLAFLICHFTCLTGEFMGPAFPKINSLELEENTSLQCGIAFSPKEVSFAFYCSFCWRVVELR